MAGGAGETILSGAPERELLMTAFAAVVDATFADPNIGREVVYVADGGTPVLGEREKHVEGETNVS